MTVLWLKPWSSWPQKEEGELDNDNTISYSPCLGEHTEQGVSPFLVYFFGIASGLLLAGMHSGCFYYSSLLGCIFLGYVQVLFWFMIWVG